MTEIADWKIAVLALTSAVYLWETYLSLRQHSKLKQDKVPKALTRVVTKSDFLKARAYGLDKSIFGFITGFIAQLKMAAIIMLGFLPYTWAAGNTLLKSLGIPQTDIMQANAFLFIFTLASTLAGLPTSLYSTFVIEAKHGFNKSTLSLFIRDTITSLTLGYIIGLPLFSAFLYVVDWAGENFVFYVWCLMFVFQIVMILIFPTLIQPLFNKFTPLEEGELKDKINKLAQSVTFPLTKLFVIDGSKRSSHSNAYFFWVL